MSNKSIVLPWAGDSRRPWFARVDGVDSIYGLSRAFLQPISEMPGTGAIFTLPDDTGLYEGSWFDSLGSETRMFVVVQEGQLRLLHWAEWSAAIHQILLHAGCFQSQDETSVFWISQSQGIGITSTIDVGPRKYTVIAVLARRQDWSLIVAAPQQTTQPNFSVPHANV